MFCSLVVLLPFAFSCIHLAGSNSLAFFPNTRARKKLSRASWPGKMTWNSGAEDSPLQDRTLPWDLLQQGLGRSTHWSAKWAIHSCTLKFLLPRGRAAIVPYPTKVLWLEVFFVTLELKGDGKGAGLTRQWAHMYRAISGGDVWSRERRNRWRKRKGGEKKEKGNQRNIHR